MYYHYSNPKSQGALICATKNYPETTEGYEEHTAYIDRIRGWSPETHQKLCDMINEVKGHGDMGFAYKLSDFSDGKLREIAKIAFELDSIPDHTKWTFWYNVSNGYGCPSVTALIKK